MVVHRITVRSVVGYHRVRCSGPCLFIVNASLVASNLLSPKLRVISFADDIAVLFCLDRNHVQSELSLLNVFLVVIFDMFCTLRLTVNASKTKLLCFRGWRAVAGIIDGDLALNGFPLPLSESAVCLGVTLTDTLSWRPHLSSLKLKLTLFVFCLHRLRKLGYPRRTLLGVFSSFFVSSIN